MSRFVSRRHSPVAALAKRRNRCKAEPQDRVRFSADAEANVADGFAAKALLQFPQNVSLGNLFELVVQCRLEDSRMPSRNATGEECAAMKSPFVQKSSVAAAKIDQPNFADVSQMRAGTTL